MWDLNGARVLVVGGTSGIGLGTALAAAELGAKVSVASRSNDKVTSAVALIGHGAQGAALDTADEAGLEAFFTREAPFDHVVVSASQTTVAPIQALPLADAYDSMSSKFWGAYRVARAANIAPHGSLTLVSGVLSVRPRKGSALQGAINAAVEGLGRGLALELAPVRVNTVAPGLVDTPLLDRLGDAKEGILADVASALPVGVVGTPDHIARQIIACMVNPYLTGSTIYLDGGGLMV